jgi:uncharacterized protein YdhG (YjbR/CyaY superfamily)
VVVRLGLRLADKLMAKTDFKSVSEYITSQPQETRGALKRVRTAIRKALPRAEETISYQIPAYKLDGRAVIYFAGWKWHVQRPEERQHEDEIRYGGSVPAARTVPGG